MHKTTYIFENINKVLEDSSTINTIFLQSLSKIDLSAIVQNSRCKYSRASIVRLMTLLKVLQCTSINSLMQSQWACILKIGKDVLYKVKNDARIHWRQLLLNQAIQSNRGIEVDENSNDISEISCFIIDNSIQALKGRWQTHCILSRAFHYANALTMLRFTKSMSS